ncbi:hypothetical protein C8P66_104180 [Humitalea rosea]|uniref:Secreted protein n=1 Tax=Humitalea rosea TaxID=990373 RepID=A0A2W7IR39_9PROT|nr:hypothetical protein [Humitalea rosea]PZW48763.1 hypothetical protein C8P66_104180 [Humitalea rosea]
MRRVTKNPFMSLWLSAANRAAGAGLGLWTAAARRQQAAMTRKAINDFWKTGTKTRRKKS